MAPTLVTLGGLVCLTVVALVAYGKLTDLTNSLADVLEHNKPKEHAMVLSEDVDRGGGRTTTITTTQGFFDPDETAAQCIARHDAAVALLKGDG